MGQEEYPSERRRESVLLVVSGRRLCIFFPLQKCLVDLMNLWEVFKGLGNASDGLWSGLEGCYARPLSAGSMEDCCMPC
jgi:hypothetical protein